MAQSSLTDEDKQALNAVVVSLEEFAKRNDSKLGASIVLIVRDHIRKGRPDVAALYLSSMIAEIYGLAGWREGLIGNEETNIDFNELRQRLIAKLYQPLQQSDDSTLDADASVPSLAQHW